ncbi:DUF6560 family protein [Anaerosporobacter sp.]
MEGVIRNMIVTTIIILIMGSLKFVFATAFFVMSWRITVDKDTIYYRNYFFITKQYKFSDLDKVIEKKNHNIIVYREGKRIFSIDFTLENGPYFLHQARVYNVNIVNDKRDTLYK